MTPWATQRRAEIIRASLAFRADAAAGARQRCTEVLGMPVLAAIWLRLPPRPSSSRAYPILPAG